MKTEIFNLAWQFAKQTGLSFSECLKKAWANFKLKKAMQKGIVKFYFQKIDGSIRESWGTLKAELMPETKGTERKQNPTVQTYFDTEIKEYRSFKKFNLI